VLTLELVNNIAGITAVMARYVVLDGCGGAGKGCRRLMKGTGFEFVARVGSGGLVVWIMDLPTNG